MARKSKPGNSRGKYNREKDKRKRQRGAHKDKLMEKGVLGTVRWFDVRKGIGFIARDSGGEDVFVHITDLKLSGKDILVAECAVMFDIVERMGRLVAVDIAYR